MIMMIILIAVNILSASVVSPANIAMNIKRLGANSAISCSNWK